jgi:hypothetical protein
LQYTGASAAVIASALADLVLVVHLAFIAFVVAGAGLLWRWPRLVWLHLPAALWGAGVEFSGTVCPLTPLENHLRALAGESGYAGGFVEHYLVALIYPQGLTRTWQWALGAGVLVLNVVLYALWLRSRRR